LIAGRIKFAAREIAKLNAEIALHESELKILLENKQTIEARLEGYKYALERL